MKLSNKGRYAIQAVFDLAYHNEGKPAQVKDICDRQRIPARFLEQVFQDLKKAGIVRSKRGPRGGYELTKPSDEVCVGDVVRAIEGPVALGPPERAEESAGSGLLLTSALSEVAEQMERCLDSLTFAMLCERAEQEGLARGLATRYVYAI